MNGSIVERMQVVEEETRAKERYRAAGMVRQLTTKHEVFGETIVDVYLDDLAKLADRIESGE